MLHHWFLDISLNYYKTPGFDVFIGYSKRSVVSGGIGVTSDDFVLVCFCYLLTYFTPFSSVSIVEFEKASVCWKEALITFFKILRKVRINIYY